MGEVDPNHDQTRQSINVVSVVLLVIGVPMLVIGICMFMSPFFAITGLFSSAPPGGGIVPDVFGSFHNAAIGFVLIMVGSILGGIGKKGLFFANFGRIARYEAGEGLPVVKDALRDLTPTLSQTVREVRGAAHSPSQGHRFCPNCGEAATTTAHFCEACGAKLDSV